MPMNSKILLLIKSKLRGLLRDKENLDVILFGSVVKGKERPNDIDIAIITKKDINVEIQGFHISILKPEDFFTNPPSIVHTLFREGYSLKHKKYFSEIYNFSNRVLFKYELTSLRASLKVKIVNILRGKGKERGMVKENGGEWLANQVFILPIEREYLFEKFFINFKIKFNKFHVLIN